MKHNVDKMMEGLANLALGHTELKERVEGIYVARCKMANTAEDITDSLRDCRAMLDDQRRSIDQLKDRMANLEHRMQAAEVADAHHMNGFALRNECDDEMEARVDKLEARIAEHKRTAYLWRSVEQINGGLSIAPPAKPPKTLEDLADSLGRLEWAAAGLFLLYIFTFVLLAMKLP